MGNNWPRRTVAELQADGILLVQDGNHGNDRPRSDEFAPTGVAFIRAADMDNGRVLFESAECINEAGRRRVRKGIGAGGDVLLSHKGTVGKVAFVPLDAPPFVCSPQTTFWRTLDDRKLNRRFLFQFLKSRPFQDQLASRAGETDMAGYVSLTNQRMLEVAIPSPKEQQRIAEILGTLDDKIELNRRMNGTLESLARGLFQSWFVDFDPVRAKQQGRAAAGLDPATAALFPAEFQSSELGEIPKGWKAATIKECCDRIHSGGTPRRNQPDFWQEGRIPWLTSGEVRKPIIKTTESFITELGLAESSAKWVPANSTVVALYGATAGQVSFIASPLTTNQAICALIPKPDFAHFNYLRMRRATDELERKAVGSAQQNLSKGIVEETSLVMPPRQVVSAFSLSIAPVFDQWVANIEQSCTLATLRDALLPKLLSGELSVAESQKIGRRAS